MAALRGCDRWVVAVVAVGLLVRIAILASTAGDRRQLFDPPRERIVARLADGERPFVHPLGFEYSNMAHALLAGQGFASPFGGETGPSAWSAPGPVAMYAGAFAIFGAFTAKSVILLYAIALVASTATVLLVAIAAGLAWSDAAATRAAAVLAAVNPYDLWLFAGGALFDLNLFTLLFAALTLLALRYRADPTAARAAGLSLTVAVAVLFHPGFVLCGVVGLIVGQARRRDGRLLRHGLLLAAALLVVVGPYLVFQRARIGQWYFVKSNAAFELYLGNTPEAGGTLSRQAMAAHHPSVNPAAYQRYRELGEAGFIVDSMDRFLRTASLGTFAKTTLRRVIHFFALYDPGGWSESAGRLMARRLFWALHGVVFVGLLLWRRGRPTRAEALVYLMILSFSLPYWFTAVADRYRLPILPGSILLAVALLRSLQRPPSSVSRTTMQ